MSRPEQNAPGLWLADWPRAGNAAHKYHRGYCTIFGAPSLTGATRLAATAALRIGAGLVTVQCEQRGDVYRASLLPEIMVQDAGESVPDKATVLLGGPGGIAETHRRILYDRTDLPRVIDSAAFAGNPADMSGNPQTVLTPHDGEFAAMFGTNGTDRVAAASAASCQSGAIIVLKGPMTVIAAPDGRAIINDRPNLALATAGTGDVLAGMIAGLMAQGMEAFQAAAAAVWIHSDAGERIGRGLIASDIIGQLPALLKFLDDWA